MPCHDCIHWCPSHLGRGWCTVHEREVVWDGACPQYECDLGWRSHDCDLSDEHVADVGGAAPCLSEGV